METVGSTLAGYAKGGARGALSAYAVSKLANAIASGVSRTAFPDVNGATSDDFAAMLAEVPDALQKAETVCGVGQ